MKKILVSLVLLLGMASACATEIKTPSLSIRTTDPAVAQQVVKSKKDKEALIEKDYSGACGDAIRANPEGTLEITPDGCRFIGSPEEMSQGMKGFWENGFTFTIEVQITREGYDHPTDIFQVKPDEVKRIVLFPKVRYHYEVRNANSKVFQHRGDFELGWGRGDAYSEVAKDYGDFVMTSCPNCSPN